MLLHFPTEGEEPADAGDRPPTPTSTLRLGHLLGSGRHGLVFHGKLGREDDGVSVAVKVPNAPHSLEHECASLRKFAHPAVVDVVDGPLVNGALVLEYCDLGTLADRLADAVLSLDDVSALIEALVPALAKIHEQGWIHGDISPGNIGLRSDDGPVLLDFATARPADGSPIDEGTAEFAGSLRQANPRLDIRALAATLLRGLGTPDRWDHRRRHCQEHLATMITRCDTGCDVQLADLEAIGRALGSHHRPGSTRAGLSGGGPDVNSPTRAFGPSPTGQALEPSNDVRRWPRVLAAVACVVIMCAFALDVVQSSRATATGGDAAVEHVRLIEEEPAAQSLERFGAQWNATTGVVSRLVDEELQYFAAGEPGDIAAVADWSCDGEATLGVFRPSTGTWFVFETWTDGTTAVPTRIAQGEHLLISTDATGCATPVVR